MKDKYPLHVPDLPVDEKVRLLDVLFSDSSDDQKPFEGEITPEIPPTNQIFFIVNSVESFFSQSLSLLSSVYSLLNQRKFSEVSRAIQACAR